MGFTYFSDRRYHNIGVGFGAGEPVDEGRFEVSKDSSDYGAFRTPTLRNISLSAPYMHDGSLPTLESVVEFYMEGGIDNPHRDAIVKKRKLSMQERSDLVAFLRSLTAISREPTITVGGRPNIFLPPPQSFSARLQACETASGPGR